MPVISHSYKGHRVTIELDEDRRGKWKWAYAIDWGRRYEMTDHPLDTMERAEAEAKNEAKWRIDQM